MENKLSPEFTNRIMERASVILERYRDGVLERYPEEGEKRCRLLNIFDSIKFDVPLEYVVSQGLFSGESREIKFLKKLRRWSCGKMVSRFYRDELDKRDRWMISRLVKDIFGASYDLGKVMFRDEDGREIRYLTSEHGKEIINGLVNKFFSNESRGHHVAKNIWNNYSRGISPRFSY